MTPSPPLDVVLSPPVDGGIVVGHDGTESEAALVRAITEAAALGRPLHVVRAWTVPSAARTVHVPFGVTPSWAECHHAVLCATRAEVDRAIADARTVPPSVHVHAIHAPTAEALVAASRGAHCLVLGHRGHGRFPLTVGSMTTRVLAQAHCPVLVVPLDP